MLILNNIIKHFASFTISDISFEIKNGDVMGLIGPSGSGKSTILKMIMGLETVTAGEIIKPTNISTVFQDNYLIYHKNIKNNIELALNRKLTTSDCKMITDFNIDINDKINILSGGEKRRVCLLIGLLSYPNLLILDEPLSSIDELQKRNLLWLMRKYIIHNKISCLFVTHSIYEAFYLSNKIVLIKDGKIHQKGTPKELYDNPISEWSARFTGDVNIIQENNQLMYVRPENINLIPGDDYEIHYITFMGSEFELIMYNSNNIFKVRSKQELKIGQKFNLQFKKKEFVL